MAARRRRSRSRLEAERLLARLPTMASWWPPRPRRGEASSDSPGGPGSFRNTGGARGRSLIGGAFGLDDAVRATCDRLLTLAPWTLPHEMARLVLTEQLYRAGTIRRGEPITSDARLSAGWRRALSSQCTLAAPWSARRSLGRKAEVVTWFCTERDASGRSARETGVLHGVESARCR